jgi:hypothetical protein
MTHNRGGTAVCRWSPERPIRAGLPKAAMWGFERRNRPRVRSRFGNELALLMAQLRKGWQRSDLVFDRLHPTTIGPAIQSSVVRGTF